MQAKVRADIPDVTKIDFSCEAKTKDGKKWNMKFSSWNINGIRAWCEVGVFDNIKLYLFWNSTYIIYILNISLVTIIIKNC